MLHYVHRLVANCVAMLFGAGQVAYSGFIRAYSADAAGNSADESNGSESKAAKPRGTAETGDDSLWVHHCEQLLLHYSFDPLYI